MTLTLLYLLFCVIPNLNFVLGFFILLFIVLTIFAGIGYAECYNKEEEEHYKNKIKQFLISAGVCILFTIPLPSTSQLKLIATSYFVSNIEGVEKLPVNVVKYVNNFLEEEVDERVTIDKKGVK